MSAYHKKANTRYRVYIEHIPHHVELAKHKHRKCNCMHVYIIKYAVDTVDNAGF